MVRCRRARLAAVAVTTLLAASPSLAIEPRDRVEPLPKQLEEVGVTNRQGAPIPLDLAFTDDSGREVQLRQYFTGTRPVVLTLGYYGCPMLCTLVLNGLIAGLRDVEWTPGEQFEIVTISIDPTETHTLARLKKQNYLTELGRPGAAAGWHFMTGREADIRQLAAAVGFGYRYDDDQRQYAHPGGIYLCTPDGRVSKWIGGVQFESKTLRLALLEASDGKIGSTFDQVLLYCYHYDAERGRYAPAALNIMRAGGVVSVLVLASWLGALWVRDLRRRRALVSSAGR